MNKSIKPVVDDVVAVRDLYGRVHLVSKAELDSDATLIAFRNSKGRTIGSELFMRRGGYKGEPVMLHRENLGPDCLMA